MKFLECLGGHSICSPRLGHAPVSVDSHTLALLHSLVLAAVHLVPFAVRLAH